MSEFSPDVRTRTVVSIEGGTVQIQTLCTYATFGAEGTVPDINKGQLLKEPLQIDGVSGKEGELILTFEDGADAWLNSNGELVVAPDETRDDPNRYSIDGASGNLIYNQGSETAPVDNILSVDGDVMHVAVNALVRGKITMNSFTETLIGNGTVKREFRVMIEPMFFTDWMELTNENLALREYESNSVLQIQIRYTRLSGTTDLTFSGCTIEGVWSAGHFNAPILLSSLFSSLLESSLLKKIDDNIFKKLYFRGIVPKYITRAENVSYDEDRDYVALFSTVSYFFSLMIAFFKRFENFRNDEELLREQVRGWGINFDEGNITLEQLQYLAQNYYSQIQQRGTAMIMTHKGDLLPNGREAAVDGELVRLLHSKAYSELLIGTIADYKMGWCMRNASPMYRGTCREATLNKTRENSEDFELLNDFPICFTSYALVNIASSSDSKRVLRLFISGNGGAAGIGRFLQSQSDNINDFMIPVDPAISYEITVAFRLTSGSDKQNIFAYFGVEGFNNNREKLSDSFINLDGEITECFFEQNFSIWKSGIWYFARGIIHSYSVKLVSGTKTNLGIGVDLSFNNPFVNYISPRFIISSASTATVELWDYKVRPLVRGKSILSYRGGALANSHSLGFVQARNFMYTYARNNNNSMSQEEITDIIEKYLYPYGKIDMFVLAGEK